MNEAIRMQVSAFVDGELPENEAELLVRRLSQDALLRKQVAEYLAIGRVMRGEYSVQGTDTLRERIAAELDERPLQDEAVEQVVQPSSRYVRPLAGFAIAATVALAAIFGLQQLVSVDTGLPGDSLVAGEAASRTVPDVSAEDLEYHLMHIENSAAFDARRAALEVWAEELGESADEESEADAEESTDAEPMNDQP